MAENEEIKSKRDQFGERLKSKYPEREYADDEELFGQINDDYDEYDEKLAGYADREDKLMDVLNSNGPGAQFLADMARGNDPFENLVKQIGIDGVKEMFEDPANIKKYAESNREYLERVAKHKELESEWEKNMKETLSMLEQKRDELGLSDEQIDEAADMVRDIMNDGVVGIIKPQTIDMMLKALNYDNAVAEAEEAGEVRGRNAKVTAQLKKPSQEGDGLPQLGGGAAPSMPQPRRRSIFDEAREAQMD